MTNALRSPLVLGLALSLFGLAPLGCTDDGAADEMGTTGDGDGDSNPTGGECFDQPEICAQFVRCLGALAPGQEVEAEYGADGSCWCGTDEEAQECYKTCVDQVDAAIKSKPTESACHENYCTIDELDATQPYGPIVGGGCSDYTSAQGEMIAQMPIESPFGVPGGFCSPACSGLANFCPDHPQTTADGTCYISIGEESYCVARCWVDPTIIGGTQCPCGAVCQPQGANDAEGNMRGLCTFVE